MRKYYEVIDKIDKIVKEQAKVLLDTFARRNAACDAISQRGHEAGAIGKCALIIRCIAKVADAYATQKASTQGGVIQFRKHAAQPYDDRVVRFVAVDIVSICTLSGRMRIPFVCGEHHAPCSPIAGRG
jgi:hypothetical protein